MKLPNQNSPTTTNLKCRKKISCKMNSAVDAIFYFLQRCSYGLLNIQRKPFKRVRKPSSHSRTEIGSRDVLAKLICILSDLTSKLCNGLPHPLGNKHVRQAQSIDTDFNRSNTLLTVVFKGISCILQANQGDVI